MIGHSDTGSYLSAAGGCVCDVLNLTKTTADNERIIDLKIPVFVDIITYSIHL